MKITYKGDYALKTILDLAQHYGEEPITINELAKRRDIPIKFLEQILLELKRGGFVDSRRGKVGGYFLTREPTQIILGEVIRYIDGPLKPIACVDESYAGCLEKDSCVFKGIWKQVTEATSQIVDNITFQDLLEKNKRTKSALIYQI